MSDGIPETYYSISNSEVRCCLGHLRDALEPKVAYSEDRLAMAHAAIQVMRDCIKSAIVCLPNPQPGNQKIE